MASSSLGLVFSTTNASDDCKPNSPILFFFIFHKAIRIGLNELHQLAMGLPASGSNAEIQALSERHQFLGSIYKQHLIAKDKVIFPALDCRVKNLVEKYLVQHKDEKDVIDKIFELLCSKTLLVQNQINEVSFQKELVSLTGVLELLVIQNMAKEEEQVFPLLIEKYSLEEQASLVWQFLCDMPTYLLAQLLSWLRASLSTNEYQDLQNCLLKIIPEEKLLQQAIFNWIEKKDFGDTALDIPTEEEKCESESNGSHPIDGIMHWHKAIKGELNETFEKIRRMCLCDNFTSQSTFDERFQFIAEICIFHSIANDKVIFPSVYGETSIFHQHAEVKSKFSEFWYLIQSARAVSIASHEFHSNLSSCADQVIETINRHFNIEQLQIIPLARKNLNVKRQGEILYQSLCLMPLRLIEQVLPWLIGTMNDKEAQDFLNNMHLAAPASDVGLIELFSSWACKVVHQGLCSPSCASGCFPTKRSFDVHEEEFAQSCSPFSFALPAGDILGVSLEDSIAPRTLKSVNCQKLQETCHGFSATGFEEQPIDILFKMHKAIRRDLEYLSNESARVSVGDETFLHQFIGRFCLLWGLYRAHSNQEDNIVYPALESREKLHNVTHSYKLDHEQEERMFEHIFYVLSELSQIHVSLKSVDRTKDINLSTSGVITNYDIECLGKYYDLSAKLQLLCKSTRMMVDQHMSREEYELWPLFGINFSVEEQHKIIGFTLGTIGAEVLRLLLPWVLSAFSQDEQNKMMDTLKHVTRNTMFSEWLNECWKGTPITMLPTGEFQGIMSISDQMLRPYKNDIRKVYRDLNSDHVTKKNLQNCMTSYWMAAQKRLTQTRRGGDCTGEILNGRSPTFRDPDRKIFGCEHYKRNCKIQAACCGKLFTCNFCHDSMSDHSMDRTPSCNGFAMAKYYCDVCKLFDDQRNIYHCPFCNICRVGRGLRVDYFHCMSCNCCLSIKLLEHDCKEKCLETGCPICSEFLFTSTTPVTSLPCGHYIHSTCFQACNSSPYTCIVCSQSPGDSMKASAESSVVVGGDGPDENVKLYKHNKNGKMATSSWTDENSEKKASGFARQTGYILSCYGLELHFSVMEKFEGLEKKH
ncbi:43kDa postsynaptic protein [Parasponia andersonii]|uniref:43kDa postsynaptic protein n=1 Tax=Parasponia andersonii TaxID=3476 RepID=A0A2P5C5G9_PARAD|nr:43kDa postsynaptic protein [Parasponia andersonii]